MPSWVGTLAVLTCFALPLPAAELTVGSLFTNNAVLQRDLPVPVWGTAEPGRKVTVTFAGQEKTATAGENGKWSLKLDPLAASAEDRTLTVKTDAANESLTLNNILVGEVWVCSGQSNMAFQLKGSVGGDAAIAAASDPQLRLFAATAQASDEPQTKIGGSWAAASPESATNFSAVGYYFGQELRKKLGVPIGLIKSAVGGTPAEAWTARAVLEANPTTAVILKNHADAIAAHPKALENYKKQEPKLLAKHAEAVAKAKADGKPLPKKPAAPQDPVTNQRRPGALYNAFIVPLQPYAIRGAIWYQGEANSARGKEYQTLFPTMIGNWRKDWGQGDFPFFFVQITPHQGMTPELREAQRATVETTQNTAMAVSVDVGHPTDIHPKDKRPLGLRLALAAQALVYGKKDLEYSGPTYESHRVDGNKLTLNFSHLGGGLVAKDGALKGFTIAGADGNFVAADAKIEGDTIVVSSKDVASPVAVRYGWVNVPDVNLFNQAGIPASPFQTDRLPSDEPGFEPLFNGTDLTGWHYQDGAPFEGKTSSSDGRYTARNGRIVVNPGKGLAQLWTTREFPSDFHLKLQFRAGVNADSGVFLRRPQLQCRDYLVAGPFKDLKNYKPQDWNDLEVVVKGGVATCTCNGEPLPFTAQLPATGPIGLEADRGQMEYRWIRIRETK